MTVEEVDVDFSAVSDDFEPLPAGWYLFQVESATARDDIGGPLLSRTGNPMIKWVTRIVDCPRRKSRMFLYTASKGPGAFWLRQFLDQAFGTKLGTRLELGPLIGRRFWGQVGPQEDNAAFSEFKNYRRENDPSPTFAERASRDVF